MKASPNPISTRRINLLELATALLLSVPAAHAQTAPVTVEPAKVDASQAIGAAVDGTGPGNHPAVGAGNSAAAANPAGASGPEGASAQAPNPKSAMSGEPPPWHPLTDF